jgi:transposase-like protein
MDDSVQRFRRQAAREIGDRRGAERRYSDDLRQRAVAYWRARKPAGDGVRAVATALGIAPVSLRRWAQDARFRPVQVVADAAPVAARLVVVIDARGVRIEGVDVATAAQLIARLR